MGSNELITSSEKRWIVDVLSKKHPAYVETLDVPEIVQIAVKNGLAAALFQELNSAEIVCPPHLKTELKKAYYSNLFRNTRLTKVWQELKELFERHQLAYVPLKGIYLSQYVYSDSTLRAMSDIDVLLKADDATKVYKLLLEQGAVSEAPLYNANEDTTDHHLPGLTYKGVYIEIHRGLFPDDATYNLLPDVVWHNLVRHQDTSTLHPKLNLLYFCLHLYYTVKRGGLRLSWLYDFIVFSQSDAFQQSEGDFMHLLRHHQCVEPVLAMLYAAEKVFDHRFPFIDHSIQSKIIRTIVKRTIYFANKQTESSTDYGYEIAFERLRNTKGLVNQLAFVKKMVFKPGNSTVENLRRIGLLSGRTLGMLRQKIVSFFRF
jgi:hypothetical protein